MRILHANIKAFIIVFAVAGMAAICYSVATFVTDYRQSHATYEETMLASIPGHETYRGFNSDSISDSAAFVQAVIAATSEQVVKSTSEQVLKDIEAKQPKDYSNLIASLVGAAVMVGMAVFKYLQSRDSRQNREDHSRIFDALKDVLDTKERNMIKKRLEEIELDKKDMVSDANVKILIEGIAERTRNLFDNLATTHFTSDMYELAAYKIQARATDCQVQLHDLKFDAGFKDTFLVAQAQAIIQLKSDLHQLMTDNINNDHYNRFAMIIREFLRRYLSDVVKAALKYEYNQNPKP